MTIFATDSLSSGDSIEMGEMGDIHAVVSPISVPIKNEKMLSIHIKKNAFLVHVATEMPLAFDEEGVTEFLEPLFNMQRLGSKNNVLIAFARETNAMVDAILAWQMFGGIAIPVIGSMENTLRVIDDMLSIPLNGMDGSKRGLQMVTSIPFPQLEIADEWGTAATLLYAMSEGNIPYSENDKELFEMTQKDRDVLREKMI